MCTNNRLGVVRPCLSIRRWLHYKKSVQNYGGGRLWLCDWLWWLPSVLCTGDPNFMFSFLPKKTAEVLAFFVLHRCSDFLCWRQNLPHVRSRISMRFYSFCYLVSFSFLFNAGPRGHWRMLLCCIKKGEHQCRVCNDKSFSISNVGGCKYKIM